MSHPFGVGNSTFRTGSSEEKKVDTVPFGFFKKSIFKKVGLFNENLLRAQDYELNSRIVNGGGDLAKSENKGRLFSPSFDEIFKKVIFLRGALQCLHVVFITRVIFHKTLHNIILLYWGNRRHHSKSSKCLYQTDIFWCFSSIFNFGSNFIYSGKYSKKRFEILHLYANNIFLYHFIHGFGVLLGVFRIITRTSPVQRN